MRQYEKLWIILKSKKEVYIRADSSIHPRIIQAVRKEKAMDLGWRYLVVERKERYELKELITGSVIKFTLQTMEYIPKFEDL
jgi:hypothetical protein